MSPGTRVRMRLQASQRITVWPQYIIQKYCSDMTMVAKLQKSQNFGDSPLAADKINRCSSPVLSVSVQAFCSYYAQSQSRAKSFYHFHRPCFLWYQRSLILDSVVHVRMSWRSWTFACSIEDRLDEHISLASPFCLSPLIGRPYFTLAK